MKPLYIACIVVSLTALAAGAFFLMSYVDTMSALRHETNRWTAITDREGSRMAVETVSDDVWQRLTQLYQNKSIKFVGGIVELYGSKWGFRFKPENLTVAEVTAEGLQATIRYVSENLDYWLDSWAYVSARITEVHS